MLLKKTTFYLLALCLMLSAALTARADGFSLTDTTGKVHNLSGYQGKWVLVNFWATWCPPCLDEIPDLIALHGNSKNNLVVLGIAMDYRNPGQVTEFADSMFVNYPIILGNRQVARQIGPVNGLPTTYLYNPQGKLVAHEVGPVTRAAVEGFIRGTAKATQK